jgi:hypothetical protein
MKKISSHGTVRPNHKGLAQDLHSMRLGLKIGDIAVRTRGDMTALVWKDKKCRLADRHAHSSGRRQFL